MPILFAAIGFFISVLWAVLASVTTSSTASTAEIVMNQSQPLVLAEASQPEAAEPEVMAVENSSEEEVKGAEAVVTEVDPVAAEETTVSPKTLVHECSKCVEVSSEESQLTLGLLGFTVHGVKVNGQAASEMPRKVTSNGVVTWHPEINVTYRARGFLYNVSYLSDSVGNPAGFIGMGPNWKPFNNLFQIALVAGLYIRKNPGDHYDLPKWIRHGNIDTIPIMWLTLQKDIPVAKQWDLSVNVSTNYFLTHILFGGSYRF